MGLQWAAEGMLPKVCFYVTLFHVCFSLARIIETFDRGMRAGEYNVADKGIIMGLGKRDGNGFQTFQDASLQMGKKSDFPLYRPSLEDKGYVIGLGKRHINDENHSTGGQGYLREMKKRANHM